MYVKRALVHIRVPMHTRVRLGGPNKLLPSPDRTNSPQSRARPVAVTRENRATHDDGNNYYDESCRRRAPAWHGDACARRHRVVARGEGDDGREQWLRGTPACVRARRGTKTTDGRTGGTRSRPSGNRGKEAGKGVHGDKMRGDSGSRRRNTVRLGSYY